MLKLVASNPSPGPSPGGSGDSSGPRILAPGAPTSPGPIPKEYALHLRHGEALVWWNVKDTIRFGPIALVALAAVSILGFVTLLAPEFWLQPWSELAKPIGVLLSPTAFVLLRERFNQCAVMVTDTAVIGIERDGASARLPFDAIEVVRRDPLRGGMLLHGRSGRVRVPPSLLEDTRAAIASQRRGRIRSTTAIEDPTGWLP